MANDLGIVTGYNDGTFKPDNAVTRAEFAAMMTRALNIPESALKGFKTSAFKDVASDHWAVTYLGYCNSKGIMTGYEDGTARPNQTITVNEAMTMICRALGYTNQAKELVGSWPANYIALAQQLSLYDDVAATATTDRASAAQIIYNALTVPLKYIDADGVTQDLKDGKNQVVTMLGSLGSTKVNKGEGFVLLDTAPSTNFPSASQTVIDVTNYKGAYVTAFTNKDGNIIAIEKISTRLTGKWKTPDTFTVDGVDYTLKAANWDYNWDDKVGTLGNVNPGRPEWVSNGALAAGGYAAGLVKGTYTIECKVNQKTIEQVYSVIDWDRANFSQFKASDLKIDKHTILVGGKTYTFPTDKANNIDYAKFSLEGVSSLEKIAKDNIVEVFTSDGTNDALITKLSVGTTTVTGDCTKVSSDTDEFDRDYTIDGKVYGYVGKAGKSPKVGTSGTAYLNCDGDIAVWDETDSASGNYALVTKAWTEPKRGSVVTYAALLLKDGTSKDIEFKDKTTVTGGKTLANVDTVGNVIVTYSLDSEGKFSKFNIETNAALPASKVDASGEVYANNKFVSSTVVFQKDSDGDWSIGAVKNFETGKTFTALYSVVDENEILAIAVNKDDVLHTDKLYGVINSVSKMDDNGTATWYVDGFVDGKVLSAFVKDDIGATPTNAPSTTYDAVNSVFGLYEITLDAENHVTINDSAVGAASCAAVGTGKNLVTDYEAKANGFSTITVSGSGIITLAKDVVVYIYDDNAKAGHKWSVGTAEELVDMKVAFFQTTSDSRDDGYYTVVLAWEE